MYKYSRGAVPRSRKYSTRTRTNRYTILLKRVAIAMMMDGMAAIQRQGGKKEEIKGVASKMQKTNAKRQAKKMIQVAAMYRKWQQHLSGCRRSGCS